MRHFTHKNGQTAVVVTESEIRQALEQSGFSPLADRLIRNLFGGHSPGPVSLTRLINRIEVVEEQCAEAHRRINMLVCKRIKAIGVKNKKRRAKR